MNTQKPDPNPVLLTDRPIPKVTSDHGEEIPQFIIIPPVPGLPSDVTGDALRDTLRARAASGVQLRQP